MRTSIELTDGEWLAVVNALQALSLVYDTDARNTADQPSVRAQFERQADEALALADKIAERAGVEV